MDSGSTSRWRRGAPVGFVLFAAACAARPEAEPTPVVTGPLPGDNYAYVYQTGDAIRRHDTRTGTDELVVAGVGELLLAVASPSGSRVAVALRQSQGSRVVAIETETGSVTEVADDGQEATYTMAWSRDGDALGVGVRFDGGGGGVRVLDADGVVRDIGCRASNRFEAWRSSSQAIVHDDANFYTVSTEGCATVATFGKTGKRDIAYAPNGRRVAFYQDRSVQFTNRERPQIVPELWIASFDGAGARVVADFQSRPRNSVWAPNAGRIVYEVVSRRWANTTHLVAYDIQGDAFSYVAEEKPLGVPNDFAACWSPDSRRFAHDRTYARSTGTQAYTTRQVVVRDGTNEQVVLDEVIDLPPAQVVANRPDSCQWMGPEHLLIATRRGHRVVDVGDGEVFEVPGDRRVLAVVGFAGVTE
jgi:hypothetical protein